MWTMLPIVAFGSAYVPEVASFVGGPGDVHDDGADHLQRDRADRVERRSDPRRGRGGRRVGRGRGFGVVVAARASSAVSGRSTPPTPWARTYLQAAVRRVTRGASEAANDRVLALGHDAMTATRTLDDAVRQYLSESGGSTDLRAPVIRAANRAVRLRTAAELIADVVPPPLAAYPRVRKVSNMHANTVCERLAGASTPPSEHGPISDDFVLGAARRVRRQRALGVGRAPARHGRGDSRRARVAVSRTRPAGHAVEVLTLAPRWQVVLPTRPSSHWFPSTHSARDGPGSNASPKYWVSRTTSAPSNSMMLTT